jgi:Na+(H+)/acetate symporter ActP
MMVFPLVLIMGILGTVVAGRGAPMFGDVYDPSAAFFILIADAGTLILILFLVLAVALVCSSADTLLNAITASVTRDLSDGRMNLSQARIVTIGLMPVAVYLATGPTVLGFTFDAASVFGIFLFADLLAAATVAPVLLTLWNRITSEGALAGAISGFLGVILYGTYTEDYMKGIEYIYKPVNEYGLANLNVFLSALIASGIVTILVSIATASEPGLTTTEDE